MRLVCGALLLGLGVVPLRAQGGAACGAPPSVLVKTAPNIFSEQQEQWLGEAMADYADSEFKPVKNAQLNAYVATIGARLLGALPPTAIRFHYTLVESVEVNGFSRAGGQVYLTRKLVASARSEDEVAGVIAHEMGHILSHQFAIETTADLRRLLGVTSVGDRADVFARYQRLVDAMQHDKHPQKGEDEDGKQDEADRVAVYAAAAAGYRPQAYAEFWDRSFFVGGKTGSRLGDLFGNTRPNQKRLRQIRALVAELPAGCGAKTDTASTEFVAWQKAVLEGQGAAAGETAAEDKVVKLTPALHLDLEHVRFSRDGKYVLAQDESSIFVLTRKPLAELFRLDAEGAMAADFTPDSKQIAFHTPNLHVEVWDVGERKLVEAHEVVAEQTCLQTMLAPDGRTLVCVGIADDAPDVRMSLIDVASGQTVYAKKSWYTPEVWVVNTLWRVQAMAEHTNFMPSSFSADGNTMLLGVGSKRLAFDLRTRMPIKLGGALSDDDYVGGFAFSGNSTVYAVNGQRPFNSGLFTFPDGKRVRSVAFNLGSMTATGEPGYVLTEGEGESKVRLADVEGGRYVFNSRTEGVDVYDGDVAAQTTGGALAVATLASLNANGGRTEVADLVTLSPSPLGSARLVHLSPDGRYLAIAARTRGAVWDTENGQQVMSVRSYTGAWWTADGKLEAQFPVQGKTAEAVWELTMSPKSSRNLHYAVPRDATLMSGHLLGWQSAGKTWTLTAYAPADGSVQWTRTLARDRDGLTANDGDDDLILSSPMGGALGKAALEGDAALQKEADAVKEKKAGHVVEVLGSADGKTKARVVVEVPLTFVGVDGYNVVSGLLYLSVGDNRTVVYSMKTGAQLRQMFGFVVAADQGSGRVCLSNRSNEMTVMGADGVELKHVQLESPARFAHLGAEGRELMVLTADQTLHRFRLD